MLLFGNCCADAPAAATRRTTRDEISAIGFTMASCWEGAYRVLPLCRTSVGQHRVMLSQPGGAEMMRRRTEARCAANPYRAEPREVAVNCSAPMASLHLRLSR